MIPSRRSRSATAAQGSHPPSGTAPLLAPFVAPTIGVVGLVGWIATGAETWLAVAVALAFVIVMTGGVMAIINRLLADDRDA